MNQETLYKDNIRIIKNDYTQTLSTEIIFRIINYKNIYFFAQEISTGSIFPIYGFRSTTKENKSEMRFHQYSYIRSGKYFVFIPIIAGNNIFEYKLPDKEHEIWKSIEKPSIEEVNTYLENNSRDSDWKAILKLMELHNEYFCDIKLIKEKLLEQRQENTFQISKVTSDITSYEPYIPSINIDEIKEFGYNLSEQDKLCNLIGRQDEKKEIIKSVSIKGESILLVGPSASGKTSIVEGLALEIKRNTNKWLKGKIIFYVNTANITSGTKYRGEFEAKLQKLIDFCIKNKGKIILFIDEMHTLRGLGKTEDSALDTMNILKPYITKGDITIIGATTQDEYKEYIAPDEAFANRFHKLDVTPPDEKMNIKIILSYIIELESKYDMKLNLEEIQKKHVVEYILNITDKKNQNVVGDIKVENPKLTKSLIEDAFAEAIYNERNMVNIEDICMAILSCHKLSPTFRKEKAEKLKTLLKTSKGTNNVLTLVKTR